MYEKINLADFLRSARVTAKSMCHYLGALVMEPNSEKLVDSGSIFEQGSNVTIKHI